MYFHIKVFLSIFLLVAIGGGRNLFAQTITDREPATLTCHFRKITQEQGLSSYFVRKIIQDRYAYTWIATQDGLNRFDGNRITIYTKTTERSRRLVSNDIWDLAEDTASDRLWVLTYSGINAIDLRTGRVLEDLPAASAAFLQLPLGWLKCMVLAKDRLWIGSQDGVSVFNNQTQAFDTIQQIPLQQDRRRPKYDVDLLWRDEYARVWTFISNYGLVLYSATSGRIEASYTIEQLGLPPGVDFGRFWSVAPLGPGKLALACNTGLYRIAYDRFQLQAAPYPITGHTPFHNQITACATDAHGRLWLATENSLFRLDAASGALTEIHDADHASPENWFGGIYSIYFDAFDHLWLGTQKGVAFSDIRPSPFVAYFQSADQTAKIDHAYFTLPYYDSLIAVCAADGFYLANTVTNTIHRLSDHIFWYASLLKNGRLLVSSNDTLFILNDHRLVPAEKFYPELASLHNIPLNSLVWCGDSLAVLGSENIHGIFCWRPQRHTLTPIDDQSKPLTIASNIVNALYHDHHGRVWILADAAISIFDPAKNRVDTFHLDDPLNHRPFTFCFDVTEAGGFYWLAMYGTGLVALDDSLHLRSIISTQQGMANIGVYKVFPWQDSLLFVTSNYGLARVRLANHTVVNYFREDGLHSNLFEEACGYADARYIYAGGERGFSRIEPGAIPPDPSPPPLHLGNIRLQTPNTTRDTGDLLLTALTVPSDVIHTTLNISAFSYSDPARTLLSYRVPELKSDWIPLGPDQAIDLIGLNPGKYTVLIRAVNYNDLGGPRQLSLTLDFLPKWYQTLWFKLLILLVTALGFYALYRYRLTQIRQQQLIRQNISSDLHDDIGSILNTIKIFTHLAQRDRSSGNHLSQIETAVAQAVVALRDMIWVLDDSLDTVFELLERIRQFAIPIATAGVIQLDIGADPEIYQRALTKSEKRNLYLMAKECLNNSLKYASCQKIRIHLSIQEALLTMHIEDDGCGFDPAKVRTGNGLRNISRRAAQIRYNVTIVSSPGTGTRITLCKS